MDIANYCGVVSTAKFVYIKAYGGLQNKSSPNRGHETGFLLVHQWEGAPLTTDHGDPVRMITPQLYAWKGAKWIGEIEFGDYDELGYWEKRGYSNTAEPWLNDRYS